MNQTNNHAKALSQKRYARLVEFLRLRREQLGLSLKEIGVRLKWKNGRAFDKVEQGQRELLVREYTDVEQALRLPCGFIASRLAVPDTQYGEASAVEILERLTADQRQPPRPLLTTSSVKICPDCAEQVGRQLQFHKLPTKMEYVDDRTCVCGGRQHSDSDILLRMALLISGARSFIILGGSEDIERACKDIQGVKVNVVLGATKKGRHENISSLAIVDVVVAAHGKVKHAATNRYSNMLKILKPLSPEKRPIELASRSSNITGIARTIIDNLEGILQKTAGPLSER